MKAYNIMFSLQFLVVVLLLLTSVTAAAQSGGGRRGGGGGPPAERREHVIEATGLKPSFPDGLRCEPISSPFGSTSRYDGSSRRDDRNGSRHGGMDISLKDGTPLLAVAAGEVVTAGAGGQLEGLFLWLKHSPEDTGLPFWTFSKYQHLSKAPDLQKGDRVTAGQVVGLSGATGTQGGHYGAGGYPHLHLTTFYGPTDEYEVRGQFASMVSAKESVMGDPMLLFAPDFRSIEQIAGFKESARTVAVPVVGPDGAIAPAGAKRVWPVACIKR